MSRGKEHIDKLIQEKLHAAEVTPPASVWDSIESSLEKKQRKSAIVLYRWLGSAAAILLLAFISLYFIRSERKLEPIQNKFSQEIIIDSRINDNPVSDTKSELQIQEKEAAVFAKNDISPLDIVEKEITAQIQIKQILTVQKEALEIFSDSRKNNTLIALNKVSQGELSSLYKSSFKALSLLKANMYKRMLENEEASILLADNSSSVDRSERRAWAVGLAFAPTDVGRSSGIFSSKMYADYDVGNSQMSLALSSEQDLPAYSGGVNLEYKLSERWSFQSGIYYLKQGQRIENFSVVENSALNNYQLAESSITSNSYFGNIAFDNLIVLNESAPLANFTQVSDVVSLSYFDADLLQRFALIEIPLLANYKIINRKMVFSIIGGISPGIIVGNNVYLENTAGSIGKTESLNTLIYKSVFGLSIEYPLSRKLYFNFSPSFKYQLNNFNKNAIVSEKLNYVELKTGLNYRF